MTEQISLFVAFGAGLASFVSPCVLPLVPVYLASLVGPGIFQPETKLKRLPVFLHALSFVIGFSMIFSLWGAGVGLLGSAFTGRPSTIRYISGGLLIVFGMFMLASTKVPWLNYERRVHLSAGNKTGYVRSFLTGAVFCLAWTPCLGPQISGILSLAANTGTAWKGTYLLAIYSLGLGIPFLAVGAAFDVLLPLVRRIQKYSVAIYIISGIVFIIMGILTLTNRLFWL